MVFGINTTRDISKLSQISAREITYDNFEISLVVFTPNITTNHAITYTNRPNFFQEILKKRLNIPQFQNKPILNLLDQNFPQRQLKSMFRLICVSNIRHFDKWLLASSDMEYIIQVENRWTGLFLAENDNTEYSVKKIARKSWKTAKKSYKFFQIS